MENIAAALRGMLKSVNDPGRDKEKWRRTPQRDLKDPPLQKIKMSFPVLRLLSSPSREEDSATGTEISSWIGDNLVQEFALKKPKTVIGRDATTCDIAIDSTRQSRMVSKVHAIFHCNKNGLSGEFEVFLVDCNSTNGTYVNGKRVRSSTEIKDNDLITFGRFSKTKHSKRTSELEYIITVPQTVKHSSAQVKNGTPPLSQTRGSIRQSSNRAFPQTFPANRSIAVIRAPSRGNPMRKTDALLKRAFPNTVNWTIRPTSQQQRLSKLMPLEESNNSRKKIVRDVVVDFSVANPGMASID